MASKYVAINSAGIEVPVKPYARLSVGRGRLGFVIAPHYMVTMDWLSNSGEQLGGGTFVYSGFDRDAALHAQKKLAAEQCCEITNV